MNLKPELLQVMTDLGITPDELAMLSEKMMFVVTSREAQLNALNAQIDTLVAQRDAIAVELADANATVAKLVDAAAAL